MPAVRVDPFDSGDTGGKARACKDRVTGLSRCHSFEEHSKWSSKSGMRVLLLTTHIRCAMFVRDTYDTSVHTSNDDVHQHVTVRLRRSNIITPHVSSDA